MDITFNFLSKSTLNNRRKLKTFIEHLVLKEKSPIKLLNFVFCSDAYLLDINKRFLKHDFYTDIITFNLGDNSNIEGDIYISVERIKDNATLFSSTYQKELHRVMFHGVLHLCGYMDKTKSDKELMTKKENYYLNQYFN
jgi:rRNA maturation RNase YbeY